MTTASDLPTRAAATTSGRPGPQPQQPPTAALRTRFPSRPVATTWPETRCLRRLVLRRLLAEPFVADTVTGEENRRRGLRIVLDWLEAQPGDTWQQRWLASGADGNGRTDWRSATGGVGGSLDAGGCAGTRVDVAFAPAGRHTVCLWVVSQWSELVISVGT